MDLATPNPPTECQAPTCQNQTNITCINCQDKTTYWLRNFTSDTPSADLTINITNSTGSVLNHSTIPNIEISNATTQQEFIDINTTTWQPDDYTIKARIIGNFNTTPFERTEPFTFKYVNITSKTTKYICNATTETLDVTITHPFNDPIEYNISLNLPPGWTYSGYQLLNATQPQNYTTTFNITSDNNITRNISVNPIINFTYPNNLNKTRLINKTIQQNNNTPILEITRETPKVTATDGVFESALTIHNKGCGATTQNTIIQEQLSTGWTPANPNIKTNSEGTDITLASTTTTLETNIISWTLDTIATDKYAVLTYQIKSPTSTSTPGQLNYNATWEASRTEVEPEPYNIQTLNYTTEAHLEFTIETIQLSPFPQAEVRTAQINKTYNYSLTTTNIGDITAQNWNVTLTTPQQCNVTNATYQNGNYNATNNNITWALPTLAVRTATNLTFSMNCTVNTATTFILIAQGRIDNRSQETFTNTTNIGCSAAECTTTTPYTFTKPNDPRYEKLTQINFSIFYNWTGQNVTIAQGYVNITDDTGKPQRIWQNYSFNTITNTASANHTIYLGEQQQYQHATRDITTNTYTTSTANTNGNVTVQSLTYTWQIGKIFTEPQNLFIKIKEYTFNPQLRNATLNISGNTTLTVGGWGETFNFTVEAADRFGRNLTIFAWHRQGTEDPYTQIGNFTCESCPATFQTIYFTYDYNGTDISSIGGWNFKFNATSPDGNLELTGPTTYTVEKDDILATVQTPTTNGTLINRTNTTTFSVRAFDDDNQTFPNGTSSARGEISISISGTTVFESPPPVIVTEQGYINRTLTGTGGTENWCDDQTSFFLGLHAWKGGTTGAPFHVKDNISDPLNFTLIGSLTNGMQKLNETVNFSRGSSMDFEGTVTDDCNANSLTTSTLIYIMTNGDFQNNCTANAEGKCSITTTDTFPTGFYNITTSTSKT